MTIIQAPVQLTVSTLLQAMRQLPPSELDTLLVQARLLQKEQAAEAHLVALAQRKLPTLQQIRLEELSAKAEDEIITEAERTELLALVEQVETLDGERAEALLALAQRRKTSVRQLLQELALETDRD